MLEQKAKEFAIEAHKGQLRKDGITPYIKHPIEVVNLLKNIDSNSDVLCASYLHDVIEDCKITKELLEKEFNPNIARIVSALTRDINREEYKKRIKNSDYQIQIVKLADMVANCKDLYSYLSEKTITQKVNDCNNFYFSLAQKTCPGFYELLKKYTKKWN